MEETTRLVSEAAQPRRRRQKDLAPRIANDELRDEEFVRARWPSGATLFWLATVAALSLRAISAPDRDSARKWHPRVRRSSCVDHRLLLADEDARSGNPWASKHRARALSGAAALRRLPPSSLRLAVRRQVILGTDGANCGSCRPSSASCGSWSLDPSRKPSSTCRSSAAPKARAEGGAAGCSTASNSYRRAFDRFDQRKVARYDKRKIEALLADARSCATEQD